MQRLLLYIALAWSTSLGALPYLTSAADNVASWDESAFPIFTVEKDNNDFPDHSKTINTLKQGFRDALRMLLVTCATFDASEDVFRRYFHAEDAELVQDIICEMAGVRADKRSEWNRERALTEDSTVNIKYSLRLTITAGFNSDVPHHDQTPTDEILSNGITGSLYQQLDEWGKIKDEKAVMQVYKRAFDYPDLANIHDKRKESGLGNKESGLMTTLGALLVHELFHWRWLGQDGLEHGLYDQLIPHIEYVFEDENGDIDYDEPETVNYINDFIMEEWYQPHEQLTRPEQGYGLIDTRQLVANNQHDDRRNADNYRWYTVSKYWKEYYQKAFGAQDDENFDDKMVPKGANGQVPFPGEKPLDRRNFGRRSISEQMTSSASVNVLDR